MKLTNQEKVSLPIELNYDNLRKSYFCLKALDHSLRQNIITAIVDLEEKATAKLIANHLKLAQSVVTKHLAILFRANLVLGHKNENQKLVFQLDEKMLAKTIKLITTLSAHK